eukprot:3940836-Rhodomonas_salina.1
MGCLVLTYRVVVRSAEYAAVLRDGRGWYLPPTPGKPTRRGRRRTEEEEKERREKEGEEEDNHDEMWIARVHRFGVT